MAIRIFVPRDATASARWVPTRWWHLSARGLKGGAWKSKSPATVRGEQPGWNPWWRSRPMPAGLPLARLPLAMCRGFSRQVFRARLTTCCLWVFVDEIPWLASQQRLTFARAGLGDPLSLENYKSLNGFKGLERALALEPQAIVDEIKESGLRGRGGAAFPTGIKWQTVLDARSDTDNKQKYIVCNADEGDSGTFADRLLMESDPYQLIEGMTIAGLAVEATEGFIYLRSEYPHCAGRCWKRQFRGLSRRLILVMTSVARARCFESTFESRPALTSAARRPRCSKAWKASVAWSVSNHRYRRSRA